MEKIVALIRDHMQAEARGGYALLRQIPSTRATACLDYLQTLSVAEQDEFVNARARVAALRCIPTTVARDEMLQLMNSDPALAKYNEAILRGPLAMGLRYESIRMAKAILNDTASVELMHRTRSTLDYVPRDDAPVPLVNDADVTKLRPAKAPLLKKLVKPLLQDLLGAKEEKSPGGTTTFEGALDGTPLKARIDYAARDAQMIYAASIPDPELRVCLVGTSYEDFFGMGGGWNYITEENAQVSIALLAELLHRVVALRNDVVRLASPHL